MISFIHDIYELQMKGKNTLMLVIRVSRENIRFCTLLTERFAIIHYQFQHH